MASVTETQAVESFFVKSRLLRQSTRHGVYLFLEDDSVLATVIKEILKIRKKEARVVSNIASAQEEIEKTGADNFACVVVDVLIPDGNGIEFIKWLHVKHPEMPTFIFTGCDESSVKRDLKKAGLKNTQVITKDMDMSYLLEALGA